MTSSTQLYVALHPQFLEFWRTSLSFAMMLLPRYFPFLSLIFASLFVFSHMQCIFLFFFFFAKAMRVVSDIEECLQGKKSKTLPMSVKGQVHALIEVSFYKDQVHKGMHSCRCIVHYHHGDTSFFPVQYSTLLIFGFVCRKGCTMYIVQLKICIIQSVWVGPTAFRIRVRSRIIVQNCMRT